MEQQQAKKPKKIAISICVQTNIYRRHCWHDLQLPFNPSRMRTTHAPMKASLCIAWKNRINSTKQTTKIRNTNEQTSTMIVFDCNCVSLSNVSQSTMENVYNHILDRFIYKFNDNLTTGVECISGLRAAEKKCALFFWQICQEYSTCHCRKYNDAIFENAVYNCVTQSLLWNACVHVHTVDTCWTREGTLFLRHSVLFFICIIFNLIALTLTLFCVFWHV